MIQAVETASRFVLVSEAHDLGNGCLHAEGQLV